MIGPDRIAENGIGGAREQVDSIDRVARDHVTRPDRVMAGSEDDRDPVDPVGPGGRAGGVEPDQVADDAVRRRLWPAKLDPIDGVARDHVGLTSGNAADDGVGAEDQDTHPRMAGGRRDRRRGEHASSAREGRGNGAIGAETDDSSPR